MPKETLSRYADAECFDWTRVALITAITRASADTVRTKGVWRGFAATNVFSLCTRGSPATLSRPIVMLNNAPDSRTAAAK